LELGPFYQSVENQDYYIEDDFNLEFASNNSNCPVTSKSLTDLDYVGYVGDRVGLSQQLSINREQPLHLSLFVKVESFDTISPFFFHILFQVCGLETLGVNID
jgi:hypothetical protein